ncbi:sensor histidine kinase [Pseudoalteromonas galatheae]|uniref:sensor histidine kinase n=1 Tax=Pseudoalteromonas galatheae TaxID=579562 RepID=UPI0030D541CA
MRRIFVESLLVLFICFIVAVFAYEWLVYGITTDYEFLLEDYEAIAHQQLLQNIADNQGIEAAKSAMQQFSTQTEQLFTIYHSVAQLPASVATALNQSNPTHIFFDDNRTLWFKLTGYAAFFSYTPDSQSIIRAKVELENNLFLIFLAISFVIFGLINIFLIYRRVRLLEQATIRFAQGDLASRADTSGSSSLGTLNRTFNDMASRIMHLVESNRALTNAVAHEMRTPIFRIQWQAELLKETALNSEQMSTIQEVIADTEEMEQMIDELLHYTKLENSGQRLVMEKFDLSALINRAKHRWQKERRHNIALDIRFNSSKVFVIADKKLLTRALDNVIRNAFKFAKSKVRVVCSEQNNHIEIFIHDDGPGVDKKHKTHIFEPFYVADQARNKGVSGYGLGLSIVQKICEQHRGSITVSDSEEFGGALFTLKLPTS